MKLDNNQPVGGPEMITAIAVALATALLMLIAFPPASGWARLSFIAVLSWLFDMAENITHFQMAGRYPNLSSFAVRFGPSFTGAKWVFALLPLPIALVGLVLRLLHIW
jgi:hypothetical protein